MVKIASQHLKTPISIAILTSPEGKSQFFMGKPTISMAIFSMAFPVTQRVSTQVAEAAQAAGAAAQAQAPGLQGWTTQVLRGALGPKVFDGKNMALVPENVG